MVTMSPVVPTTRTSPLVSTSSSAKYGICGSGTVDSSVGASGWSPIS